MSQSMGELTVRESVDWTATVYDPACTRCSLCREATTVCVPGRGNPRAEIMLVGEAPGAQEDKRGLPFVGKAGRRLSELLAEAEIDESRVWFTNAARCFPSVTRTPKDFHLAKCADYLWAEIEHIQPKVIVALGKSATKLFVATKAGMGRIRGQPRVVDIGTDLKDEDGKPVTLHIPVVPTWHPSYVMRVESD